jgi:single-strand DNA-binding protein
MKSVNKVILLGNLTRDPELRYTEHSKAVCVFGLATNRSWTTETGEKREEPEYHRLVAWDKLAELCDKYLRKGRKVYVEGRLQSRSYTGQDGSEKFATEIVIDDLVMLDPMPQAVREALDFHDMKEI